MLNGLQFLEIANGKAKMEDAFHLTTWIKPV